MKSSNDAAPAAKTPGSEDVWKKRAEKCRSDAKQQKALVLERQAQIKILEAQLAEKSTIDEASDLIQENKELKLLVEVTKKEAAELRSQTEEAGVASDAGGAGAVSIGSEAEGLAQKIQDLEAELQKEQAKGQKSVETWKKRAEKLKVSHKAKDAETKELKAEVASKQVECNKLASELETAIEKLQDHGNDDSGTTDEMMQHVVETLKLSHATEVARAHTAAEELRDALADKVEQHASELEQARSSGDALCEELAAQIAILENNNTLQAAELEEMAVLLQATTESNKGGRILCFTHSLLSFQH